MDGGLTATTGAELTMSVTGICTVFGAPVDVIEIVPVQACGGDVTPVGFTEICNWLPVAPVLPLVRFTESHPAGQLELLPAFTATLNARGAPLLVTVNT